MSVSAVPVALLAGFVSFLAPCVLPLVPGYLSAVSAVDADKLGQPGTARRVVVASVPFVLGFTVFFVLLGVGASLVGGSLLGDQFLLEKVAGFVLVVFGLAFMRLLPWPERLLGAGLLAGARSRGSRLLLGGAFAVCAAPCIGPVLAATLVLAGSSDTVAQGALLLLFFERFYVLRVYLNRALDFLGLQG
jgi:cytochrome c-type biogenesis protein